MERPTTPGDGHESEHRQEIDATGGCEHVDFSDDNPERCGDDAVTVRVGGVTTRLCPTHAARARQIRAASREATA